MPARLHGFKGRLRCGAGIGVAIALVGGLPPTGTAQSSTLPARGPAAAAPRAYLDELTIALPPSAELARRLTSSRYLHQSATVSLREVWHSMAANNRIKDSVHERAWAFLRARRATTDLHKPTRRSRRIVVTIAAITSAFLLIALLIVVRRWRRATPSAEDRAVAYMQVRHGHYWQPPNEPAPERPVDPSDRAGPATGGTPG
jgi:hypothetical protein